MSIDPKDYAQGGIITAVLAVVSGLLGWRLHSKVKHDNAAEARESRFEENVQKRLEAALGKISELSDENDALKAELGHARARMTMTQLLADGDKEGAIAFARQSGYTDLDRPLRPQPQARPRSSPHDPFQAADPYGPKKG